ncbi:tetratricopeptide repeat protein [Ferrovibrio sp.]|uniref:tetratricopeptide repeat protein n=1 Tax=Ferrovibrio sp. TaxID=1917215 RepID=UPI00351519A2
MQPALLQHLQSGLEAHRQGRLAEAEQRYRAVLAHAPETLDAINLLGRLLIQTGRAPEAASQLRRALDLAGRQAALWLSYTEALLAAGDFVAAREAAETARQITPQEPDAIFLWAEAQRAGGAWSAAAGGYRQVLALRPGHAAAALQLATCLQALGETAAAITAAREAVRHAPQAPECHNNLGNLLMAAGDLAAALGCFEQALRLRPQYPSAQINMAAALRDSGRLDEALAAAQAAVQTSQGHADAWQALGQAHHARADMEQALAAYRSGLERRPEDPELHWNFSLSALAAGDFAAGWPAYGWRWRKAEPPLPRRHWPWPRWPSGADPAGRRLLLWGEQGLGDRLLFLQYLPALLARGASVTLETDPRLVPLLRRSFDGLAFAEERPVQDPGQTAAGFDGHLPLGDLPVDAPPGQAWLRPDQDRAARLRAQYRGNSTDILTGLSWRSANPALGAGKSVRVGDLAPLAQAAGRRFVCLQYDVTETELAELRALFGDRLVVDPAIDARNDLDGLAAQIAALDLTVTVSNVTAHLAGAMGLPVWVLAPSGRSLFYYLMAQGSGTPWYPTMRIFRPAAGKPPAGQLPLVAAALQRLAKSAPK